MLTNYLTITLRNFRRRKFYTFINVFGLALGLASSMFIAAYVLDELRFDRFHRDADRVYRVTTNGGEGYRLATTPPPLYEAIKNDIPEVEAVARAFSWNHSTMRLPVEEDSSGQTVFRETSIYIVDPDFLQVLDFNVVAGDAATALKEANSIVLTRATAGRYFGQGSVERGEVLGKEILFGGSRGVRRVTAVVDPGPTHFPFDMLVDQQGYQEITDAPDWGWNVMYTYLKVRPEVQADAARMAALSQKIDRIAQTRAQQYLEAREIGPTPNDTMHYELQAVTDIHLRSQLQREHQANGSITTVYTLAGVALLIILLACINFINLSTAQATRRAKEVGVRKVLGSPRRSLILQFLSETMAISLVAMLLALGAVEALRIPFNALTGKQLTFDWFGHPELLLALIGGVLLVGFVAGGYPAFYLSSFRPVAVLSSKSTSSRGAGRLRNALIVFQFVVSITLVVSTAVVVQQLQFIQQKDIGYVREQVLVIKNDKEIQDRWKDFKAALSKQSSVQQVSFATGLPTQPITVMRDIRIEGSELGRGMAWFYVDPDYVATLGLSVTEGRGFQEDRASDQTSGVLLNESAVRALGLVSSVGQTVIKNKGEDDEQRLRVLGVIKDFNVETFDQRVKPIAFQYFLPSFVSDYVLVQLAPGNMAGGVEQVAKAWSQFEPDNPLVYSFLDEDFDRLFRSEQRLAGILSVFTSLAIIIACLGLLGLVAFVTAQRTKEIGVRKVLGASVSQITRLLSRDFLRLVMIAFLVAIPLSYWAVERWLENFVYRTEVGLGIFTLAGGAALLVAGLTVSIQSLRAARANPVDSLRDE